MVEVAVTKKKASSKPSTSRKTIKTKKTEEEDCECIVCGEAGEDWIQCSLSAKWAHEICTSGIEDAPLYTCDLCI